MTKTELNQLLKEGDRSIEAIKKQQNVLIHNYVKVNYSLMVGDKVLINGITAVIVDFDVEGTTKNVKLKYKQLRYNGNLNNVSFSVPAKHYEKLGKYEGKY